MSVSTLKIGKQEFVVVPRKRYEQLTRREQDLLDAEIVRKAMAKFDAGKLKCVPLAEARKKWGV